MKKLLKLTVAAVMLSLVAGMWNCQKTEIGLSEAAQASELIEGRENALTILRGGYHESPKDRQAESRMILGSKKENPYSVSRMTAAWNNLYPMHFQRLPATHLVCPVPAAGFGAPAHPG